MAQYEQKNNSGSLFVNDKGENESRPDRTGDAMIDGVMYRMAGWVNTSANGKQYLSMKFTPKDEVHKEGVKKVKQAVQEAMLETEDIPF